MIQFEMPKIGPLFGVQLPIAKMNLICGKNNSGKTFVTHAIFAYLDELLEPHGALEFDISGKEIDELCNNGVLSLDLDHYVKQLHAVLDNFSDDFSKSLDEVYASPKELFRDSAVRMIMDAEIHVPEKDQSTGIKMGRNVVFSILWRSGTKVLELELKKVDSVAEQFGYDRLVREWVNFAINWALVHLQIGGVYISSSERTGAAIFQKELDFTRSRMLDMIANKEEKLEPWSFLGAYKSDYPKAVSANVDFIRSLPSVAKKKSQLLEIESTISEDIANIIGGSYVVNSGEIEFLNRKLEGVPGRGVTVPISSSSSTIRSLLDLSFYLLHQAKPTDVLIIDEPELNLHPENQVKLARLLAKVSNLGITVILTTHSDYIVRELGILVMANRAEDELIKTYEIPKSSILEASSVEVFQVGIQRLKLDSYRNKVNRLTLVKVPTSNEFGIEPETFNTVIDGQNERFEQLRWS